MSNAKRQEYEKWAGRLEECDDQDRWLTNFGLWILAWSAGVEAFRKKILSGYTDGAGVHLDFPNLDVGDVIEYVKSVQV